VASPVGPTTRRVRQPAGDAGPVVHRPPAPGERLPVVCGHAVLTPDGGLDGGEGKGQTARLVGGPRAGRRWREDDWPKPLRRCASSRRDDASVADPLDDRLLEQGALRCREVRLHHGGRRVMPLSTTATVRPVRTRSRVSLTRCLEDVAGQVEVGAGRLPPRRAELVPVRARCRFETTAPAFWDNPVWSMPPTGERARLLGRGGDDPGRRHDGR